MFVRGYEIILDSYAKYTADAIVQLLVIGSIIFLLIKEKKSENRLLAYYSIVLIAAVCFPIIAYIITKITGASVYWRVFWLIPSVIIISLSATKLIEQLGKKSQQRIWFLAILIAIMIGGKSVYRSGNFEKSTNMYKLPQEVIELCEMVAPDEGTTKMIVPETIISYIRQYNPNIKLLYGRNIGKDYQKGKRYRVLLQLNSSDPDYEYITTYTKKKQCIFVVLDNTTNDLSEMEKYGYEFFGSTLHYSVYKLIE